LGDVDINHAPWLDRKLHRSARIARSVRRRQLLEAEIWRTEILRIDRDGRMPAGQAWRLPWSWPLAADDRKAVQGRG
jgi:hypothetical protein